MSTSIYLDKQSIRLDRDNYLTFVFGGCNNLVDDSGSRVFSWFALRMGAADKAWGTVDEMNAYCDSVRAEKQLECPSYKDSDYGSLTGLSIGGGRTENTTFGNFKGLWAPATRKAITVSALRKIAGVSIMVSMCPFFSREHGLEAKSCHPKTGKELMRVFNEFKVNPHGGEDVPVYIKISGCGADKDLAKNIRKTFFSNKTKPSVSGHVVLGGLGEFMTSVHERGYSYSLTRPELVFSDFKKAREFADKCRFQSAYKHFQIMTYKVA